jgi:hypothetical protein
MIETDSNLLQVDPAKIALGVSSTRKAAAEGPDPEGAACASSLSVFRSALFFSNLFTGIVAVLAAVTLGAIVFIIVEVLVNSSWSATNTLAAIAAAVTGGGAAYLRQEQKRASKVLKESLADVKTYCGAPVSEKLG